MDTTGISGLVIVGQIRMDTTGFVCVFFGLVMGQIRMDTIWVSGLVFRGRINYGQDRGYWPGYGLD